MTRQPRRAFLAGAVGGLAAFAGCSGVPFVGGSDSRVEYDAERLRSVADPSTVDTAAPYPGPVPDGLAEAHYERARALLDGVPTDVSVPNGAVQHRLRRQRESATESLSGPPSGVSSPDGLGGWRYDRSRAAEVRGAYAAATGEASADEVRARRVSVRTDLAGFRTAWTYRGEDAVAALAVHDELETLVAAAERALVGRHAFPEDPKSAVFAVGEVLGDLEDARARVDDAVGLRDAYVTDEMDGYWTTFGTAARRLEHVVHRTRRSVRPYAERDARPSDFRRDVDGTPAEFLFAEAHREVVGGVEQASDAFDRTDYATAVAARTRVLVGLVALDSVVDAIRDGEYVVPASTDAVLDHRERAVSAFEDALAVEPSMLAAVVATPVRFALEDAERELGERTEYEGADETPDHRDVQRAVGQYAFATHAAAAVPVVVDRVVSELEAASA